MIIGFIAHIVDLVSFEIVEIPAQQVFLLVGVGYYLANFKNLIKKMGL